MAPNLVGVNGAQCDPDDNEQRFVVNGHHRLRAAKELGLKEVPVQQVELPFAGYKLILPMLESMRASSIQLVTENGEVIAPEWRSVASAMKSSQAWAFLRSPEEYLDNLLETGTDDKERSQDDNLHK